MTKICKTCFHKKSDHKPALIKGHQYCQGIYLDVGNVTCDCTLFIELKKEV